MQILRRVRPGDIVYNPMNMTLGAVGYIMEMLKKMLQFQAII